MKRLFELFQEDTKSWEKSLDKDNIRVFKKSEKDSASVLVKAEAFIPGIKVNEAFAQIYFIELR